MAKYVVAGKADCPFYARAELLADELRATLHDVQVHKIVIEPASWDDWVQQTCKENGWSFKGTSPLIWRELIERGGKGLLIGNCNDFLEMAKVYYGITCQRSSEELRVIAQENLASFLKKKEIEHKIKEMKKSIYITITSASHDVAYYISSYLCGSNFFLEESEVHMCLYDEKEQMQETLRGVAMELQDCAPSNLVEVITTNSLTEAFKRTDLVLILDGLHVKQGREESKPALLQRVGSISRCYGKALNEAKTDSTVVMTVGKYSFLLLQGISKFAPNFPKENLYAVCRPEENLIKNLIAKKVNVSAGGVRDVLLWGIVPDHYHVDCSLSTVRGYDGAIWGPHISHFWHDTTEITYSKDWLKVDLPKIADSARSLREGSAHCNAMAFVSGLISQLDAIFKDGDRDGFMYSLGLISKGWFGVPEGMAFSFPVVYGPDGELKVAEDITVDEFTKGCLANLILEISAEYELALDS